MYKLPSGHIIKNLSEQEVQLCLGLFGMIDATESVLFAGNILDATGNTAEGALWEAASIASYGVEIV